MLKRFAAVILLLLPIHAYAQVGPGPVPYRGVNNWNLIFGTDNTYDIGAVASTRPRTGYFGTSVVTPALTVSGLTSTRVPVAGVGGLLGDFSTFTFNSGTGTVSATNFAASSGVTAASVTDSGLTSGRITQAGTAGLLQDDADLTFSGSRLTATDLTVTNFPTFSAGTNTRVPFFGAAGVVSDDADMTFDGTSLSVDRVLTDAGADATPNLARAADTDDGIVLGEVSYFVRDSTPTLGFSASGNARTMTFCASASCATGAQLQTNSTYTGVGSTALALTAASMTNVMAAALNTATHSYTWTNAQVAALGATTTGDITVATLPAKTQVVDAMVVITGAAAGPTTVTVSCGDAIAGTPFINYVVASDAKAAANTVYGDALAERGTSIDTEWYYLPSYTATTLVTCHFISSGGNLSTVTGSTGRVILTTRLLP